MKFIVKNWLPIILGIAVIAAIALNMNHKPETNNLSPETMLDEVVINELPQCFLYERESDLDIESSEVAYDREYIELSMNTQGLVTGQHLILPYGIDTNRANFVGISMDGYINVVATANAEGETWQEQRMYKIENDKLYVGYQEVFVPRYENENGIYLYEDINKVIFDTDEFYLSAVNCESVDRSEL